MYIYIYPPARQSEGSYLILSRHPSLSFITSSKSSRLQHCQHKLVSLSWSANTSMSMCRRP